MTRPDLRAIQGKKVIFYFPTFHLGGAERQAALLAREWLRRGLFRVEIWGSGAPGRLSALCDQYGIPWRTIPDPHCPNRLVYLLRIAMFGWRLRQGKPDILMPYLRSANILCSLVARAAGATLCIWNQRNEGYGIEKKWRLDKLAVPRAARFIANAARGADYLVHELHAPPERVCIIPNGIEPPAPQADRQTWRRTLALPDETFTACMVANVSGLKDHATLLRAWKIVVDVLARAGLPAMLLCAGRYDDAYAGATALVEELGIADSVRFLGPVEDVAGVLSAVDLGVFSSRSEGLPNGVLEPMALGLAIAGSDIPGIRQAVGEAGAPFLAPPGDAEELAARIVHLARQPEERRRLGEMNRARVADEFSLERLCDRTAELLAAAWQEATGA